MSIGNEMTTRLKKPLFAAYIAVLVWVILFKMQFSVNELQRIRQINLIPFYYDGGTGKALNFKEVIENFLLFLPFGVYITMSEHKLGFFTRIMIIALSSLGLEVLQYALSIGVSDVTDVISNVSGGVAGILIYKLIVRIFKSRQRADKAVVAAASLVTAEVIGLAVILFLDFLNL